jgi:cyclopropane fatty-acyl-phospholipid synthase-like methyltransferase
MLDDWIVIDSHNGNKRFFEQDYERSVSRWNTKNNRKIMIDKYYKEVGEWLRYRESKNVLDIGINMFNIYNKSYFNNEEINYYQMDISVPTELKERLESTAIMDNFIELEKRYEEYIDHFDVIISYGVLGYIEFTPEEIRKYLLTASTLLKKDGRLYLKLDKKHMKKTFHKNNIVSEQQLLQYFKTDIIKEVISPDHILDDEHVFYVLNKK